MDGVARGTTREGRGAARLKVVNDSARDLWNEVGMRTLEALEREKERRQIDGEALYTRLRALRV